MDGAEALSDAEILTLVIDSHLKDQYALEAVQEVLDLLGGLKGMQNRSAQELAGMGRFSERDAAKIGAAFELSRRCSAQRRQQPRFTTSAEIAYHLGPVLAHLDVEEFHVLFFNANNRLIAERRISQGGMTKTIADPRVIFRMALHLQATAIVLAHNHPSGDLRPSAEDIAITQQIIAAGALLEVKVLDHLIITSDGYYSFEDHGGIKQSPHHG
jgi:DNA repair protein RadC